jgi:hypothetical protein
MTAAIRLSDCRELEWLDYDGWTYWLLPCIIDVNDSPRREGGQADVYRENMRTVEKTKDNGSKSYLVETSARELGTINRETHKFVLMKSLECAKAPSHITKYGCREDELILVGGFNEDTSRIRQ